MEATVLIPTHDHGETLRYAISSVQAQTVQDFEIFVIGDGAPEITRDLMADLMRSDRRIRFFDHPKGARHGELYRHSALAGARGRTVCYLCDDDLWVPSHLDHLTGLLRRADLANTAEVVTGPNGEGLVVAFDFGHPLDRAMIRDAVSGVGLSCGGHTMEAYRRLPHGWRTTPKGIPTDTYMWQQFLDQPWCHAASSARPSVVKFAMDLWKDQPAGRRLAALDQWLRRLTATGGEAEFAWSAFSSSWGPSAHPGWAPRNRRLNPQGEFEPYRLGDTLEFSDPGARARYLSWGWTPGDGWGVWSQGEESRITLSLDGEPRGNLALRASLSAAGRKTLRTLPVDVVVNGRLIGRWKLSPWKPASDYTLEFPAARWIDLRFLCPAAALAGRLQRGADHRALGFRLRGLSVRQAA